MITQVLAAVLLIALGFLTARGVVRRKRVAALIAADPSARSRFFLRYLVRFWLLTALVPAIAWSSPDLSAAKLGWIWPSGVRGYLAAAYYVVLLLISGFRARKRMRSGHVIPRRARTAFLIPQTARERRLAVAVSITAGITEETIFRGALVAIGVSLYHLPFLVAAAGSLLLFTAGHLHQGTRGALGAGLLGGLFAALFAFSGGSLLLPILVHIIQDLVALLLIPAHPTPREPARSTPAPASTTPPNPRTPPTHPASPAPSPMQPVRNTAPAAITPGEELTPPPSDGADAPR